MGGRLHAGDRWLKEVQVVFLLALFGREPAFEDLGRGLVVRGHVRSDDILTGHSRNPGRRQFLKHGERPLLVEIQHGFDGSGLETQSGDPPVVRFLALDDIHRTVTYKGVRHLGVSRRGECFLDELELPLALGNEARSGEGQQGVGTELRRQRASLIDQSHGLGRQLGQIGGGCAEAREEQSHPAGFQHQRLLCATTRITLLAAKETCRAAFQAAMPPFMGASVRAALGCTRQSLMPLGLNYCARVRVYSGSMLEVTGLHKRYGDLVAVEEVSFVARPGEMVGLLGPNGAGKTTTVSMIAGLLAPDRGEVRIDGGVVRGETDPVKLRLGLVPQDVALHDELSARQNLALFGALYGMRGAPLERAMESAFDVAGLADRAKDRVATFSGGMKRRLNLAAALLHGPQILLLDEPTVGVDPQSRNQIFSSLEGLKRQGKTLVYTTHYMEEAERLCDNIIIIDHGKVIANDTLEAVRRLVPSVNVLEIGVENAGSDGWLHGLRAVEGVAAAEWDGSTLRVTVRDLLESSPRVLVWLRERDYACSHLTSQRADLETVFLTLTGRSVRNA